VKLLRVMQDQDVRRVGSTTSTRVDVRIIAATNRDLEQLVKEEKFRSDLFYRLKVVPITLPSLAERREDIPMLVHHFLQKYAAGTRHAVRGVLPETMALLTDYQWPGNVRELENAIERALSLSHGPLLTPEDLPNVIRQGASVEAEARHPLANSHNEAYLTLEEVEKRHLIRVLKEMKGNKVKAAKTLGIDRRTLYRMAERFGLELGEEAEGTVEKEATPS
jgi:two-component system, NtrC family, response regulator AtoC